MKKFQKQFLFLLFLAFTAVNSTIAQDSTTGEINFEVNRVLPYISISKEELIKADNLADLNRHFKTSWVKEYISVEVLTIHNGVAKKSISKCGALSEEQKSHMEQIDLGSTIAVAVTYLPENNLKNNDPKNFDFTFTIDPESEATYMDGQSALLEYLKEKVSDQISDNSFERYDLAAIQFTVNESGEIVNPHIFDSLYQPYDDEVVNTALLKAISEMPCWKPAEYADGTKVKQDFIFTVGNMESCVVNLLNIRRLEIEE